ncbi:HAD-IIIC family phosphatase [Lachnospiraceae bacterium OttesenSCG-928-D06]|nr:HAD-IIIC family phosphatase [Lachnospiraceae bacterium OttesenSCG-928-D06]
MKQKIALLSNINLSFVIRMLKQHYEIYEGEGYGNELGELLNPESSYNQFAPQITVFVIDLMELIEHDLEENGSRMDEWFAKFSAGMNDNGVYFISDACLSGAELEVFHDRGIKGKLEEMWLERLISLCEKKSNVEILPYSKTLEELGLENAFSQKMWYMGHMLHSKDAQDRICKLIMDQIMFHTRVPKKVLLLDLDNTLWGGLAGEHNITPIILSSEHTGLAYKNLQRVIGLMEKQGVILGIVSKNNEEDAMEIISNHAHMVLKPEQFAIKRINWKDKHENIIEIANELNLGLDSFVFFDDSKVERALVKKMLPEVTVPDFPEEAAMLPSKMAEIHKEYFAKATITKEDLEKTEQYAANAKRTALQGKSTDYESYLRELDIHIYREDPKENKERLLQLLNKTNQFNLTSRRYEMTEIQELLQDETTHVFLYRVTDCFGDNGIVAVGIVRHIEEEAVITDLVMSCRVMGRRIEYGIMEDIENTLMKEGAEAIRGIFCPTAKNKPVAEFYEKMEYQVLSIDESGNMQCRMLFTNRPKRVYYATIMA